MTDPSHGASGSPGSSDRDAVRQALLASGWRQGSVLPPELCVQVEPVHGGYHKPEGNWPASRMYVLVSQDCDIVHGDLSAEPAVEVILAKKRNRLDGRFQHLRSPRILHVNLIGANGGELPVEIQVRNRGFLSRSALLDATPVNVSASPVAANEIAALVSRRYLREARPEEFDSRLGAYAKSGFEALLEREVSAGFLLDVMFHIEPLAELASEERYSVTVYAVLRDEFDDEPRAGIRARIDSLQDEIRSILDGCEGIDVDNVLVVGRSEIDLRLREKLRSLEIVWPRFAADASDDDLLEERVAGE